MLPSVLALPRGHLFNYLFGKKAFGRSLALPSCGHPDGIREIINGLGKKKLLLAWTPIEVAEHQPFSIHFYAKPLLQLAVRTT